MAHVGEAPVWSKGQVLTLDGARTAVGSHADRRCKRERASNRCAVPDRGGGGRQRDGHCEWEDVARRRAADLRGLNDYFLAVTDDALQLSRTSMRRSEGVTSAQKCAFGVLGETLGAWTASMDVDIRKRHFSHVSLKQGVVVGANPRQNSLLGRETVSVGAAGIFLKDSVAQRDNVRVVGLNEPGT